MGIYLNQRNYFTAGSSGFFTNVNRVFPGTASSEGGNGAELLAYNIWNNVWGNKSQVDVGIDLRTSPRPKEILLAKNMQIPLAQVARRRCGATPISVSLTFLISQNYFNQIRSKLM